jgi:hypothetical protein
MKTLPWRVVSLVALLAMSGIECARAMDPLGLAEEMPGASWKQVMKEFRRLDADRDGVLSLSEKWKDGFGPEPRNLYHIPDEAPENLPQKWTTGVNLVWEDGTVSRAEFWRLLMMARSLPPDQRAVATRSWLLLRKSAR